VLLVTVVFYTASAISYLVPCKAVTSRTSRYMFSFAINRQHSYFKIAGSSQFDSVNHRTNLTDLTFLASAPSELHPRDEIDKNDLV
jgi:hypothetical protein